MALNSFVTDASNIGSVLIQVASFGQRRLNNSSKMQGRLLDASRQMWESMGELRKYCKSLSDDELDHVICHYENLMQMIANSLKEDAARKSFIVEVKKYRESKAMVEKAMIFVENVSAMTEKRRVWTERIRFVGERLESNFNTHDTASVCLIQLTRRDVIRPLS
ncbi:hypothetical protein H2248_004261 [Termitomyces sp. 'cryptogamus']|nr:hypothetical protein H2248_004261 [Termitomyces sp. 'cryptogamus']